MELDGVNTRMKVIVTKKEGVKSPSATLGRRMVLGMLENQDMSMRNTGPQIQPRWWVGELTGGRKVII